MLDSKLKYCLFYIILICLTVSVYSETNLTEQPAWILFEMGILEMNKGEYGEALALFQLAQLKRTQEISLNPNSDIQGFPEVEMALGDIFLRTEPEIAEIHYQAAYKLKDDFYIENEKYIVLYKLVELYKYYYRPIVDPDSEMYFTKMRDTLLAILEEDNNYYENTYLFYDNLFIDCIADYGFNKFFELYRLNNVIMTKAHAELGLYYYLNNDTYQSIKQFLFYFAIVLDEIYNELTYLEFNLEDQLLYKMGIHEPDYGFHSYEPYIIALVLTAEEDTRLKQYLTDIEFYKNLYYLGMAIYNSIETDWARDILYDQIIKEFLDAILIAEQLEYDTATEVVNDRLTEEMIVDQITEKMVYKAIEVLDIVIKSTNAGEYRNLAQNSRNDMIFQYDFLKY